MLVGGQTTAGFSYANALQQGGCIPIVIPSNLDSISLRELIKKLDVVFLTGGEDVAPFRYGEENHPKLGKVNERRDEWEYQVLGEAKRQHKPIFGTCRGEQMINVFFGGTLYQDIPGHKQEEGGSFHERRASVVEGTLLHSLVGSAEIATNSFHHQAVKVPAPGFRVAATADDGIIEAIEPAVLSDRFILGVQWHPERYHDIDETSAAIFRAFVNAAKNNN